MALRLESPAFQDGGRIPPKYSGEGEEATPPLCWSGIPEGTQELALICEDIDTPLGITVTHWVLYGIDPSVVGLPEGLPRTPSPLAGVIQGRRSFGKVGYMGPAPPGKRAHRYTFRLYALDAPLGLEEGANRKNLEKAMRGRILEVAELTGSYSRGSGRA